MNQGVQLRVTYDHYKRMPPSREEEADADKPHDTPTGEETPATEETPALPDGVVLGTTSAGESIVLSHKQRRQGTYVIGVNGTGKTTLLGRIALHDMSHPDRHGVCVIDPHGDLIDDLMDRIPKERAQDVILFDPSERDWPFALNLFAQPLSATEVDLLASEIVGIFAKVFGTNWGPRIEDVTRNLAMTLLTRPNDFRLNGQPYPAAMDEVPALLRLEKVKEGFEMKRFFDQQMVTYRSLYYRGLRETGQLPVEEFWVWDYDTLTPRPRAELVSSVLNKVRRFLTNPLMRNIVAQTENRLDLSSVMDGGKILLVKLSKGRLGDDNANFLGSLIVAKLAVAIFARAAVPRSERRPFHIIVDEFQNFATSTFPTLLTEARKYAVDLVIAHQYRDQLRQGVQGATTTVGNVIAYRTNGDDADELARELDHARHLPRYEVITDYVRVWYAAKPESGNNSYRRYFEEHLAWVCSEFRVESVSERPLHGPRVRFSGLEIYLYSRGTEPSAKVLKAEAALLKATRLFPGRVYSTPWGQAVSKQNDARAFSLTEPTSRRFNDAYRAAANALTQLPNYHATCRLISSESKHVEATFMSRDWDSLNEEDAQAIQDLRENIEQNTHDRYCRKREDVERELEQRYSTRLQAVGLPPLEPGEPLPEVDKFYEED